MLRVFTAGVVLATMAGIPAWADTIDGKIVSLDISVRQLTLESGETFNLLDSVAADQLAVDQIVHVVSTDGTVDAVSVDVIQDVPITNDTDGTDQTTSTSTDTPSGDTTVTDTDTTIQDPSVSDTSTSSDSSMESSTSTTDNVTTDQNASDTLAVDPNSPDSAQSTSNSDTTTVTDGSDVDYNSTAQQ
jgi:hypothetical protein